MDIDMILVWNRLEVTVHLRCHVRDRTLHIYAYAVPMNDTRPLEAGHGFSLPVSAGSPFQPCVWNGNVRYVGHNHSGSLLAWREAQVDLKVGERVNKALLIGIEQATN